MASETANINNTWEKVLEYASSPLHGTMSRKIHFNENGADWRWA